MKKVMLGLLLGGTILFLPVRSEAHERQCPQPIEISYEDAQELLEIAWCEAGNQGVEGQRYVMSVVLNRVSSDEWPNSVHEVIHQPHQFATRGMSNAQITPETHYALAEIEMGNLVPEIIAFEKTSSNALDVFFDEAFDFRDHTFYTLNK